MRKLVLLVVGCSLAACSPSMRAANERGGIITNVRKATVDEAFAQADAHCRQHGRVSRTTSAGNGNGVITFDCVEP